MKARVPHAYYWYGNKEYGTPEVEFGVIRNSTPQPPGPRVPPGMIIPGDNTGEEDDELFQALQDDGVVDLSDDELDRLG